MRGVSTQSLSSVDTVVPALPTESGFLPLGMMGTLAIPGPAFVVPPNTLSEKTLQRIHERKLRKRRRKEAAKYKRRVARSSKKL
jgi:hypothetical protein